MEGKSCTQEGHNSLVTSSWTFHQNKLFSSLKILFLPSKMKSSGHFPFLAENFLSHSLIDSRRCSLWRSSTCKLHKSRISFPGGLEGLEQKKKSSTPHSIRESGLATETNWRHVEGLPAEHHCGELCGSSLFINARNSSAELECQMQQRFR